jgi:hypothetical protein
MQSIVTRERVTKITPFAVAKGYGVLVVARSFPFLAHVVALVVNPVVALVLLGPS